MATSSKLCQQHCWLPRATFFRWHAPCGSEVLVYPSFRLVVSHVSVALTGRMFGCVHRPPSHFSTNLLSTNTDMRVAVSNQYRGRVMSGLGGSDRGANAIAPAIGGWIAYSFSNRTCLYAQALPPLLAFFATWAFLPAPPLSQSARDARDALLLAMARVSVKLKHATAYAPVVDEGDACGDGERNRGEEYDEVGSSGGSKGEQAETSADAGAMSTWALCMAHRTSLTTVTLFATCLTVLRVVGYGVNMCYDVFSRCHHHRPDYPYPNQPTQGTAAALAVGGSRC